MKRAIEENIQITNALFDKIKEHDEAIKKMSITANIKKNKTKIYAVIGGMLAMVFEEFGDYIVLTMPGTPFGQFIKNLASIALYGAFSITMYVFGNKYELEQKKDLIREKNEMIQGLVISNQMKDHLLAENKITIPKFEKID